jgi:hypothetical protein
MESKEAVRERMRRYRQKKRGDAPVDRSIITMPPEVINPVIMKMFKDIEVRLSVLESRPAVEKVVTAVTRGKTNAVSTQRLPENVSNDLFKRVIAEKEARLRR